MEKKEQYLVILSSSGSGEAPRYNGVSYISGLLGSLEEAKKELKKQVADYAEYAGISKRKWKPGYNDDPDGSTKWAENYYAEDGTKAWVRGFENWEKAEIFWFDGNRWVCV